MKKPYNVLDLFSGAGGMSFGFHAMEGFRVIGAVDAQNGKPSSGSGKLECNKTYRANIGISPMEADLGKVSPEEVKAYLLETSRETRVDVLISCAPCTGYSRTIRKNLVENDARNSLVVRSALFVKYFRPKVFLMENVGELLRGKFSYHFKELKAELESLGYSVSAELHSLDRFGLPQRRKRALIIAVQKDLVLHDLEDLWRGYSISPDVSTVRHAIAGLPAVSAGEVCKQDSLHVSPKLTEVSLQRLTRIPHDGGSWPDLLKLEDGESYLIPSMRRQIEKGRFGPYVDVYGRMAWNKPAVTIKRECSHIGNGRYSHPEQDRLCTVREMGVLQGFPKNHIFVASSLSNMYRHIGDAVPPLVSYQVASVAKWTLTGDRPEPADFILPNLHITANEVSTVRELGLQGDFYAMAK